MVYLLVGEANYKISPKITFKTEQQVKQKYVSPKILAGPNQIVMLVNRNYSLGNIRKSNNSVDANDKNWYGILRC